MNRAPTKAILGRAPMTTLHAKAFHELTPLEVYRILQLRSAIFVVEQACAFQDIDDHDLLAVHVLTDARRDAALEGCVRVFGPGVTFPEASFGRLATASSARGSGLGRALVARALGWIESHTPGPVRIAAQSHLEAFYRAFGFGPVGEPYVEDGIPHVHMVRAR